METDEKTKKNRDKEIHFRVTQEEKDAIVARAEAAGYKKYGNYLRELGLGQEVKERLPPELKRQLVGIGTNLNQIARLAQAGKSFASHEKQLLEALNIIRGYLS